MIDFPSSEQVVTAANRSQRIEKAAHDVIEAHDAWTEFMNGLEFDDPLSDAINALRAALQ